MEIASREMPFGLARRVSFCYARGEAITEAGDEACSSWFLKSILSSMLSKRRRRLEVFAAKSSRLDVMSSWYNELHCEMKFNEKYQKAAVGSPINNERMFASTYFCVLCKVLVKIRSLSFQIYRQLT
jgi:hypothetical protein